MDLDHTNNQTLTMRVCNRAIYHLWALFLLGFGMLLFGAVLFVMPSTSTPVETEASVLAMTGMTLSIAVGLRIAYIKYSALYTVTTAAITARYGLIAQNSHQIRMSHVRSVGVTQSILGRLLGFGDLEFASAGTNESEIVFKGVRKPMDMKLEVTRFLEQSSGAGQD